MNWLRDRRDARWALLGVILVVAGALLIPYAANDPTYGIDGGFYLEVARHVMQGDGVSTHLSLYHAGYETFPHPTPVYPLWPILLAAGGALTSLSFAATWLPVLLFLVSLALLAAAGRRALGSIGGTFVDHGHVLALLLAFCPTYQTRAHMPYTEALGYTLVGLCMVRAPSIFRRANVAAGAELGVLLALSVLARSQLVVLVIAALMVTVWVAWQRRAYAFLAATVGSLVVCALPEAMWMSTCVVDPTLGKYLKFETARANDILSPFDAYHHEQTLPELLHDRLYGLQLAFTPEKRGYFRLFSASIYVIPLAGIVALVVAWRARARAREAVASFLGLRSITPEHALFALFALGNFALLQTLHKSYMTPWPFARRHAIPLAFLIALAGAFLMRRKSRGVRALTVALLVAGIAHTATRTHERADDEDDSEPMTDVGRDEVVVWLEREAARRGKPLVVAAARNEAQRIGWRSENIGIHWIWKRTPRADLEKLITHFGTDILIVNRRSGSIGRNAKFMFERTDVRFGPVEIWRARADHTERSTMPMPPPPPKEPKRTAPGVRVAPRDAPPPIEADVPPAGGDGLSATTDAGAPPREAGAATKPIDDDDDDEQDDGDDDEPERR